MIPVGQPYRPAGTFDAKSILITTILGTTAAVIGAALVWLWEWSPIPTLVLFTSMFQGIGVGAVMAFAIGRLRMRNTRIVAVVGFACGLLSIVLVHYGHYLHLVTTTTSEWRAAIAQDKSMPEGLRQSLLTQIDTDPAAFIDPMLVRKTHHSGFLGSLFLRNQRGLMVKSAVVSGVFLWILWGVEALMVAGIASLFAWERAAAPSCEDCGYWCVKQPDLFFLPGASAAALVEAVRDDNASRIAALRSTRFVDDGSGFVSATLHACPGCDQSFADISQRVVKGKETKVKSLLNRHRVSPEVVDAIRNAPVPAEVLKEDIPDEDESPMPEESEGDSRYPSI
jgi:uncharacterized membrane protein (Fun14 family)